MQNVAWGEVTNEQDITSMTWMSIDDLNSLWLDLMEFWQLRDVVQAVISAQHSERQSGEIQQGAGKRRE